ncbi:hypothetical protein BRD03_04330 [Halobacteriales archaeon QS_9_68_17]|nr:MAG: hypothetical protein BRD03_04330 [Halobacteriales archaeon QS_9_68_17]
MVLKKLKSLLGFDDDGSDAERQRDIGVTVEREPAEEPDTESEDAVKGTTTSAGTGETAAGSDAAGSAEGTGTATEPTDAADAAESDESALEEADEPAASGVETADDEAATGEAAEDTGEAAATEGSEEAEDAEPADEAAGGDVTEIKGIGPAYGERLANVGIDTVAELADADAGEVAEQTDLSEKRVSEWIERAKVR